MIMSMTGFCSRTERIKLSVFGEIALTVEIKTLNARFFELLCKLPSGLSHLEFSVSSLLQDKLIRGRIYVTISLVEGASSLASITPSWQTVDQYVSSSREIQKKYGLSGELTISDMIHLPDVFSKKEQTLSSDDEKLILAIIDSIANDVVTMRLAEGKRLEKYFDQIFHSCQQKIEEVTHFFEHVMAHHKDSLSHAIAAVEQNSVHIEELQATINKIDIYEEVSRFKSHLQAMSGVLKGADVRKGKQLDFILQELLRETNTMVAKCPAYEVSSRCIDIKVEIEKGREQVQNLV